MSKKESYETPQIVWVVAFLFVVSIAVFFIGVFHKENPSGETKKADSPSAASQSATENGSLEEYFKVPSDGKGFGKDQQYLLTDPFRDMCSSTAGDNKPAFKSNTVCLR